MQPRTLHLPKPLLPIMRKPLIGHILDFLDHSRARRPIIVVDYLAPILESYLVGENIKVLRSSNATMAENFLIATSEEPNAEFYWGLSSDVLIPTRIAPMVDDLCNNTNESFLILAELPSLGHKRWKYVEQDGYLVDIVIQTNRTSTERASLVLHAEAISLLNETLSRPITEVPSDDQMAGYQTGWTFLLKHLAIRNHPIRILRSGLPVYNINVPTDLPGAQSFIRDHFTHALPTNP